MEKFNESLKELLTINGLSPMDFSKAIGVSHTTIGDWLNNGATPSLKSLIKISDYFHCSIDYLLCRTEEKSIILTQNPTVFFTRLNILIEENASNPCKTMRSCKLRTSDYYDWKYGKIPMIDKIVILADYFSCSVDYLVGRTDYK